MLTSGKNIFQGKNPTRWFSSHHSQESINQEQTVTSIRNLTTILVYPKIPTYNWTFTPIPNWTWSCRDFFFYAWILVCVWLPNNWYLLLDAKFFTSKHIEDLEALGYKTLRRIECSNFSKIIWFLYYEFLYLWWL